MLKMQDMILTRW